MSSCKKNILSVLLIIMVLPLLFCNVDASKSSKAKKAKRAYKKYVSAHTESDYYTKPDYKITDVNGDAIPELLFINCKDLNAEVWTFRGGKMRRMFKEGFGKNASFAYKKSKHQVAVMHMYSSGFRMQIYKAKKTKLKKTKIILEYGDAYRMGFTNNESMRGTIVYTINNKRVKKKVLKKAWNKYKFTDPSWKVK